VTGHTASDSAGEVTFPGISCSVPFASAEALRPILELGRLPFGTGIGGRIRSCLSRPRIARSIDLACQMAEAQMLATVSSVVVRNPGTLEREWIKTCRRKFPGKPARKRPSVTRNFLRVCQRRKRECILPQDSSLLHRTGQHEIGNSWNSVESRGLVPRSHVQGDVFRTSFKSKVRPACIMLINRSRQT
jgi:hypothetical protein